MLHFKWNGIWLICCLIELDTAKQKCHLLHFSSYHSLQRTFMFSAFKKNPIVLYYISLTKKRELRQVFLYIVLQAGCIFHKISPLHVFTPVFALSVSNAFILCRINIARGTSTIICFKLLYKAALNEIMQLCISMKGFPIEV